VDGDTVNNEPEAETAGPQDRTSLAGPRIEPVDMARFDQLRLALFDERPSDGERILNVTRTWANHPALMKAQRDLQVHLLRDSPLPPRLRELAILRIGWRCNARYELAQHARFGLRAGLDEAELARVTEGPDAAGWSPIEAAIIRSADEMYEDHFVSDETWSVLAAELSPEQMIDLLSVVGRYWTVSVVLNSIGVQLEDDTRPFDDYLQP
jgi:alkylhydroperoxidase family enzyme